VVQEAEGESDRLAQKMRLEQEGVTVYSKFTYRSQHTKYNERKQTHKHSGGGGT